MVRKYAFNCPFIYDTTADWHVLLNCLAEGVACISLHVIWVFSDASLDRSSCLEHLTDRQFDACYKASSASSPSGSRSQYVITCFATVLLDIS